MKTSILERLRLLFVLAALITAMSVAVGTPAGAQSGGCVGGPYAGATPTDSDGDGASDADEVLAGTDECDPDDTPTTVCGSVVADYDPATTDTDGDGFTDAVEDSDGSDKCDSTSLVAGASATTNAPVLALTGPGRVELLAAFGLLLVALGLASQSLVRRAEQ